MGILSALKHVLQPKRALGPEEWPDTIGGGHQPWDERPRRYEMPALSAPVSVDSVPVTDTLRAPVRYSDAPLTDTLRRPVSINDFPVTDTLRPSVKYGDAPLTDVLSAPVSVGSIPVSDTLRPPVRYQDAPLTDTLAAPADIPPPVRLEPASVGIAAPTRITADPAMPESSTPPVRNTSLQPASVNQMLNAPNRITSEPRMDAPDYAAGTSQYERDRAKLLALQGASPLSKVSESTAGYSVEPPHKMSRLKAMGLAFLNNLKYGAHGGLGGMLGAGAVGLAQGAISPHSVQKQQREREIAKASGQVDEDTARQMKEAQIDDIQAQIEQRRNPQRRYEVPHEDTYALPDGSLAKRQWNAQTGQYEPEVGPDGKPVIAHPATVKPAKARERQLIGTTLYEKNDAGAWEPVLTAPAKAEKPQPVQPDPVSVYGPDLQQTQTELEAARKELEMHQANIRQKEATWTAEAQKRYREWAATYNSATGKPKRTEKSFLDEVKAEDPDFASGDGSKYKYSVTRAAELKGIVKDKQTQADRIQSQIRAGQMKPKRVSAPAQTWSKSAWLKANPTIANKLPQAIEAAQARGIQVID